MRSLTSAALGLALGATTLSAQHPQVREGFWIGFGFGAGPANISCGPCSNVDQELGATVHVRLGGTLNDRILLGGEINGWGKDDGTGDWTFLTNTSFAVYFYPRATGGLFVRGGIGYAMAAAVAPGGTAEASGYGLILGGGYDIRVGPRISIVPSVSFLFGVDGDMKEDGNLVDTGVKHSVLEIGLGLTFH